MAMSAVCRADTKLRFTALPSRSRNVVWQQDRCNGVGASLEVGGRLTLSLAALIIPSRKS